LEKTEEMSSLIYLCVYTGSCYHQIGNSDSALFYYYKGLAATGKQKDDTTTFELLNKIGVFHVDKRNIDSAEYYFLHALKYAQKNKDKKQIAVTYNNLGIAFDETGNLEKAYMHYQSALKYFKSSGMVAEEAIGLNNIGLVNLSLKQYRKAILFFRQAIVINEKHGSLEDLGINYSNLGSAYKELKILDSALWSHKKSLEIALKMESPSGQARAYMNLGNVYRHMSKNDEALESYIHSLKICEQYEITYGEMLNRINLGELYTIQNKLDLAEKELLESLHLSQQLALPPIERDICKGLYLLYEKKADYKNSFIYLKRYTDIKDSLIEQSNNEMIHKMQQKLDAEESVRKKEQLEKELILRDRKIKAQQVTGIIISMSVLVLIYLLTHTIFTKRRIKRYNRELEQLNAITEQSNHSLELIIHSKDKLMSVISHDLRSPMSSMLGMTDLFINDSDGLTTEEKKNMIFQFNRLIRNSLELLDRLLRWTMAQQGRLKASPGKQNLKFLLDSEIQFQQHSFEQKGIMIRQQIHDEAVVWADPDLLQYIFRNIIQNAHKFTANQGEISIATEQIDGMQKVTIQDNGIGIPKEHISQLFDIKGTTQRFGTNNERGSGLGLLLVKEFVSLCDGSIAIFSEEHKGTRVEIMLPTNPPVTIPG
jgi:two-component system, sensor histidine kinase and response regulator